MYSRTILLAAATLAVAGMSEAANAASIAHEQILATLRVHYYRSLFDPYFMRGHYVVRSINPAGRVVLVEIDPRSGAFIGEFMI